jgi:hypothetical protein
MRRLRLPNEAAQNPSQGDGFFHRTARASRGQSLQMKREVVLDRCTRLNSFNLESSADIGQGRRTEREGLGMVLLPSLIFSSQVESARVLKIGREDNGLVSSFSRELHTQVPGVEGHKDKVEVLRGKVFGSKSVEAVDSIPKCPRIPNVLPSEGG